MCTLYIGIYIHIYIYIHCDWQHWQRMSSSQSTKALSDCFPFQATSLITVQIGDGPRGSKSYPTQGKGWMQMLLWILGPPVQAVCATSHQAYG